MAKVSRFNISGKPEVKKAVTRLVNEYLREVNRVIESDSEFADLGFIGQDIVDTRRFLESRKVNKVETKNKVRHEIYWDATDPRTGFPYPEAIWTGFFAYGGSKWIEGRRFDTRAWKNLRSNEKLVARLRKNGIRSRSVRNNDRDLP